jgi:hypothetical protein
VFDNSFSASCNFIVFFKKNQQILMLLGEELVALSNGTVAELPAVKLPNLELPLRLGLMDIQTINQTDIVEEGHFS